MTSQLRSGGGDGGTGGGTGRGRPMAGGEPIAVVGMAVRAPMAADQHEFWSRIVAGAESLSVLDGEGAPPAGPDGGWVPVKGVLAGADEFDADFFGFSAREAALTDPQHRVFLELVWHALEDSGHPPDGCGQVGVFASATQSRYGLAAGGEDSGVDELQARIATESDFLATRVAYRLDLHGPALTVQTACSSSLVAVHQAVHALRAGDCDTAVAGGMTITLPLCHGYRHQQGSILSPDGHCRVFDAAAAGTVPGNGGAAVVLRRLADAVADGDDCYAVVLGSAVNNDGARKVGFTAPGGTAQQQVIARALRAAGVAPDAVGLVEAHGTGTALGDPVEVGALRRVFGARRAGGSWCGLSAVKSGIGHLDAAAGIVGFVAAVRAVQAGIVPPVVGFRRPNPDLHLERSVLRVVTGAAPWPVPGPRVAGVSAFGVGGTNAHVVLGEAPAREAGRPAGAEPVELPLTGRTPAAVDALARSLADHLARHPALDPADVAYTLAAGRVRLPYRRTVTGSDLATLVAGLRAGGPAVRADPVAGPGPVAVTRGDRVRVHLPGYPFQRRRYWWDEPAPAVDPPPGSTAWLAGVFHEVLGRAPASDAESFFELGGDSLMAIQLISRVSAGTGVEPDLEQFFDRPTVAGLAGQIAAAAGPGAPA